MISTDMSKRQDKIRLRKRINGWKGPVRGYEEHFECVLHVPAQGLVIYQIKTLKGCEMTGSPNWCTTTGSTHAEDYLRHGRLWVIHAKTHLSQISTHHDRYYVRSMRPIAWRDATNETLTPMKTILSCPALICLFDLQDYGLFFKPMKRIDVINAIKAEEKPQERLRFLKGIVDEDQGELENTTYYTQGIRPGYRDYWRYRPEDYLSVGAHLTAEDLVEFLDDPSDIVRTHCVRFLPTGVRKEHNPVITAYQISFLFDEKQLKKAS